MIKNYTSIEQSNVLAEILPKDTADMYYEPAPGFCTEPSEIKVGDIRYAHPKAIPAWSLGALINILPKVVYLPALPFTIDIYFDDDYNKWTVDYENLEHDDYSAFGQIGEYLIDAVYDMIVELNKRNLL